MAGTAAALVDRVLPAIPYRQWVLSFPRQVRFLLARDGDLLSQVLDLKPGGDAMSRLMVTVLAAVAEFERPIRERTLLGRSRARKDGRQLGRPRSSGPSPEEVRKLRVKKLSWSEIAAELGCTVWLARARHAESV